MSYTIFYDRRFIKIPDHGYIPMVQMGDNNVFEISGYRGREIPEKTWFVLNTLTTKQIIFSESEIMQMASHLEEDVEHGNIAKTRYTFFKPGEITKWFKSGIKNARTLEEYISWGNTLTLEVYIEEKRHLFYPTTTEELLNEILMYQLANQKINVYFEERQFKIPRRPQKKEHKSSEEFPYVIETNGGYLYKMGKRRIYSTYYPSDARKFKTAKEAKKYIEKYGKTNKWRVVYIPPKTRQLTILENSLINPLEYKIDVIKLSTEYIAYVPDLPSCMSKGTTYEEALENVQNAIKQWIEKALEKGKPIPLPGQRQWNYR